jgi:large subunit ribosomal protein L9
MQVFLKKDIEKVGLKGEIIKVNTGYARNFLIPRGHAVEITLANKATFEKKALQVENRKKVIETETSMLAEKIAKISVTIKRKLHDDGKLYGALNAQEVVDALTSKGLSISKSQVKIDKSIKAKGSHKVIIKLSSRLQPQVTVNVISE